MTIDHLRGRLKSGLVIPAHPLALGPDYRLDERGMSRLSKYYHAAGVGGIAVGVHTTQFEIRHAEHGLYRAVLHLTSELIRELDVCANRSTVLIAGVCGKTAQAVGEAAVCRELGFDAVLVSLAGHEPINDHLIRHLEAVAEIIPIIGFYLQPSVGGIKLDRAFWRRAVEVNDIVAIKIAPFNRYGTIDVVRGVVEAGRAGEIALYTGNDDNIVADLLTRFSIPHQGDIVHLEIVGGLLGQWACWTASAVELHARCRVALSSGNVPADLLTLGAQLTEANGAIFDVDNNFQGCIPGIHYVLQRQGLLDTINCLDPGVVLSPGQKERIDRVNRDYPKLTDATFVAEHLEEWK